MKYLIMRVCYSGKASGVRQLVPFIFPNQMVHAEVFKRVKALYKGPVEIVSAGEVTLGNVDCCGGSETLGVESRESIDSQLINCFEYLHGIET